ncbi:GspH/FimT family pseudopilin [Pseudoduganella sp. GCM10020061]|uniref:GspH/FimT family pseudopilin n=1 Tax=Pseudoduganella sp. GCM10020061 TaxID=3317345 RepID=UPI00362FABE8
MVKPFTSPVRQRGVNAVELMTVLAIVAVLAGVAAPGMTDMVASQRVKAASSDIHTALLLARSEAIKRNTEVEISPSPNGWAGGWTISDGGDSPIGAQGRYSNLTISGPDSVVYSGTGRLSGDTAPEFELGAESTDNVRCVTVDLSGRPAIKKTAC